MKIKFLLLTAALLLTSGVAHSEESLGLDELLAHSLEMIAGPRAKLLILGTFHFDDAGLDDYKPRHEVEVGSSRRQTQLASVIDDLARFAPTKIAIEYPKDQREKVQRLYEEYRRGERDTEVNEVFQIGFRLAHRLEHERVYPVDVQGRHYLPRIDRGRAADRLGMSAVLESPWYPRYERVAAWEDELKTRISLQEFLLYLNDPRRVRAAHGVYLVGGFKVTGPGEYPGPDHTSGWWYNRNLRIFANLLELADSPDERIFLLIGHGHLPILRHAAEASPEIELVEPIDYIRVRAE